MIKMSEEEWCDIYKCEHCNKEFSEDEILITFHKYAGGLSFCPHCFEQTRGIIVAEMNRRIFSFS